MVLRAVVQNRPQGIEPEIAALKGIFLLCETYCQGGAWGGIFAPERYQPLLYVRFA